MKINKKIIISILILIILLVFCFRSLNNRNSTDLWSVYTKINNGNWEKHLKVNENQMIIKLRQDDIFYVSLYENSTVLYCWDIDIDKINGLEMIEKKKDENGYFFGSLFHKIKEGENYDRVVFTFKAVSSGNENIVFSFKHTDESQIHNINLFQFEIEIIK